MPSNVTLPPKENALFKRILKCYEQKQYKNGLKFAKQILTNPKFSEHGETQAMKGLILNCLGRKEEAYDHVRRGLTNDLKSHVCWHVYGLLQRSDKKYAEAIKCYRNALKWDKDNIQILRDLSLLQIQMRDLEGYKETRHQLFQLRPTQRASWIGFAMSYHLMEDFEMALKILEEFRKTQKKPTYDYEYSELLLYQNMVIRESGDVDAALSHLELYEQAICDKITFKETKGRYLLQLGRLKEAESLYVELLKRNPENHEYYKQLEVAREANTSEEKLAIYVEYQEKFPRAQAPKRLPLNFLTGAELETRLSTYIRAALRKGVPPLFVDLRPLYLVPEKFQLIETLLTSFLDNQLKVSSFESSGSPQESPTSLLWTYYFLSQHYDYKSDYQGALDLVNTAIEHTPTLIELFTLKGKIYKHAGDPEEAVKWLDEAQSMDTADRYINCKAAKYMLRANKVAEAEAMCGKFTREGVPAMDNLNEMQCMWFQSECALAYQRLGQFGESLKKCSEIDRHFTEIIEDQFDFHTYCMRKMTLKAYVDLLRLENQLRSHKFYEKTAAVAIKTYIRLHDKPLQEADSNNDKNCDELDPSELKKRKNKAKKAKRKAEQEKAMAEQDKKRKELHNKNKKKNEEELDSPAKDELIPEKLERPEEPLEEAAKFLTPLLTLATNNINTHLLAFEIYLRKGKVLLMLRSIKQGLVVDPTNYQLQSCIGRFLHFVATSSTIPDELKKVLRSSLPPTLEGKTCSELNTDFLAKHKEELPAQVIGARVLAAVEPKRMEEAVKMATQLDPSLINRNLETCREVLELLNQGDFGVLGKNSAEKYKEACREIFPIAKCFKNSLVVVSEKEVTNNLSNHTSSQERDIES
eukprot:GFUD01022495.1.p1 GENE.GFUD01022495.1~~GFUD01022495.1.p1  ORF type:complete len:866 (+),score=259.44 GFUD01022495.1:65-2662(+)